MTGEVDGEGRRPEGGWGTAGWGMAAATQLSRRLDRWGQTAVP